MLLTPMGIELFLPTPYSHNQIVGREKQLVAIEITDMDYRSYALPCYPFEGKQKEIFIKQFEARVAAEISDMDYCLAQAPYTLSKWLLAA